MFAMAAQVILQRFLSSLWLFMYCYQIIIDRIAAGVIRRSCLIVRKISTRLLGRNRGLRP